MVGIHKYIVFYTISSEQLSVWRPSMQVPFHHIKHILPVDFVLGEVSWEEALPPVDPLMILGSGMVKSK